MPVKTKDTNAESAAAHVGGESDWYLAISLALAFLTAVSVFVAGLHEDRLYQLMTTALSIVSDLLT